MDDVHEVCCICGASAIASVIRRGGGVHAWYCLRHYYLHDAVAAALRGWVGLVKPVHEGIGTFWGFTLHDLEGAPIATFAYMTRDSANAARDALVKIVVDSAALIRMS
jgi:hypothetical protein